MNKGIWAISIAAAFAVGMMIQAIPAEATHSRDNDASHGGIVGFLQEQVETIQTEILSLQLVSHEPLNVSCPPGSSINVINEDGTVECADNDTDPTNEIQDLSLDPTTNFLSISNGKGVFLPEVGDEVLVDSCPADHSIRVINADGTVECEEDTDTKYSAAAPLTLSGTAFGLSGLGCTDGEVLKWNNSIGQWECAADNDATDIPAGSITTTHIADGTIVAADLGDSACADGELLKWNDGTSTWGCAPDVSGILTETDPQVGATTNGQWCKGTGSMITCDVTPVVDTNAATLCLAGQYLDGDGTCKSVPTGGIGSITTYIARGSTDCPASSFCSAQANCEAGDIALGGGFTSVQSRFFQVYFNAPIGLPEAFGWGVSVFNDHPTQQTLTATAICLDKS